MRYLLAAMNENEYNLHSYCPAVANLEDVKLSIILA